MEQVIIMFVSGVMVMVYHENLKIIKFRVVTLLLLLLRANQRHERVHVFIRPAARQEPVPYPWDISSVGRAVDC